MKTIEIGGHRIGPGHPTYLIAEMSANHQNDYDRAVELVHAAHQAGANAIKLQTYTPDTLTIDCDREEFLVGGGTAWEGRRLYDLYGEASMPWEWQPKLQEVALELGLDFFSTPFDATAIDFLEGLDVPAHKIASFEIVDLELVRRVAATGKPLVLSTGMASLAEIERAVAVAAAEGNEELALLKCNSAYPAPPEEMNLATIPDLKRIFGVPIGLSDHTLGTTVAVAAVALGASLIEKHLTLSREEPGPDSAFSLEPAEFQRMAEKVRGIEKAVGGVHYGPTERERASRVFRRSLFVVEDVAEGEPFTTHNLRSIRPGSGLAPRHLDEVLGRTAVRQIDRGTPFSWDLVREGSD